MTTPFATVTVHGRYVDLQGKPATGTVKFSIDVSGFLTTPSTASVVVPQPIRAHLDPKGAFSVQLPCTDNPDLSPQGFTYRVAERIGLNSRSYSIAAPHGDPIDLSTVAPVAHTLTPLVIPRITGSWSHGEPVRSILASLVTLGLVSDETTP